MPNNNCSQERTAVNKNVFDFTCFVIDVTIIEKEEIRNHLLNSHLLVSSYKKSNISGA